MMSEIERLIAKHRLAIDRVQKGDIDELPDHAYQDFYSFYLEIGEIPYGTAKARDGDPYQWVNARVLEDVQSYELF